MSSRGKEVADQLAAQYLKILQKYFTNEQDLLKFLNCHDIHLELHDLREAYEYLQEYFPEEAHYVCKEPECWDLQ
jgi:hypothetical protein